MEGCRPSAPSCRSGSWFLTFTTWGNIRECIAGHTKPTRGVGARITRHPLAEAARPMERERIPSLATNDPDCARVPGVPERILTP